MSVYDDNMLGWKSIAVSDTPFQRLVSFVCGDYNIYGTNAHFLALSQLI